LIALVIFALLAIMHDRWWTASWLLAIPVFIKLWPLAVVLLLAACWPKRLLWRFAIVAIALALLPFLSRPPSVVIGQYQEWYVSLTGPQQHRWPGFRDAWTIWETMSKAFHWPPVSENRYRVLQLVSALAVLGWCLWQKRRLGAMPTLAVGMSQTAERSPHAHDKRGHGTVNPETSPGELLTAILSIWVSWQLLFGPGTEQITYGIIAPSAAWAVMVGFEQREIGPRTTGAWLRLIFHRGWTILAWLLLGLFGMGDIENPVAKICSTATMLLPLGVLMFSAWLVVYESGRKKAFPTRIGGE
jgi:alpha-1,2-mannosyltransferase